MLPLLETAIGFVGILLVLSLLVKSLTSLAKNTVDYYSDNMAFEVSRLVEGTIGASWEELRRHPAVQQRVPWIRDIHWARLGPEYLTVENMTWVLSSLGASPAALQNLQGRLEVHRANLKYFFELRMKNLAVALGLALCLGLNINALTIWQTLYVDGQLRATFAEAYAQKALELAAPPEAAKPAAPAAPEARRQELQKDAEGFKRDLQSFMADVQFGVGRIWRERAAWPGFLYEFVGSLLTGILVSIGAPYLHDLLRALTALRQPRRSA